MSTPKTPASQGDGATISPVNKKKPGVPGMGQLLSLYSGLPSTTRIEKIEKNTSKKRAPTSSVSRHIVLGITLAVIAAAATLLAPTPISSVAWNPKSFPLPRGPLALNRDLSAAELLYKGKISGPESFAFSQEGVLYTGLADGRIMRSAAPWPRSAPYPDLELFVHIGGINYETCGTAETEADCGRPLGLAFGSEGQLYVCDASFGLLSVNPKGRITVLAQYSIDGAPITACNSVAVGKDGMVYFTDSSSKHQRKDSEYTSFESAGDGRLLRYNPATRDVDVLMSGLHYANGLSISPDGSRLLVSETTRYRIRKYDLRTHSAGDVFADNLPGSPENLHWSQDGQNVWVALSARSWITDVLAPFPLVRDWLARVITKKQLSALFPKSATVVSLSAFDGAIERTMYDPANKLGDITSAAEVHGQLVIGSSLNSFIGAVEILA
mmetsp:Transcript_43022/g.69810  ORF Transcript_43022/g.69810 Transcript_43022/m.69810 type:complete len:440 (+) Transcript_43022:134-1453(+)